MSTINYVTTEEFLAIPDDGKERDLIRGVVRVLGRTRSQDATGSMQPRKHESYAKLGSG